MKSVTGKAKHSSYDLTREYQDLILTTIRNINERKEKLAEDVQEKDKAKTTAPKVDRNNVRTRRTNRFTNS